MAFLYQQQMRNVGRVRSDFQSSAVLRRVTASVGSTEKFDIFLSHSVLDADTVYGVKTTLEDLGRTVYVDWIEDPQAERARVTPDTANLLRKRMRQCGALFYLHSTNATQSRWMPWELGYFDAFNGNVAILPLLASEEHGFKGQEYLGLYPYITVNGRFAAVGDIEVNRNSVTSSPFDSWKHAADKLRPLF